MSYPSLTSAFRNGTGVFPGWFLKLVVLSLIWGYLHHFVAGIRYLIMDVCHASVSKEKGRRSAVVVLVVSLTLTVVLGAKLFGLF